MAIHLKMASEIDSASGEVTKGPGGVLYLVPDDAAIRSRVSWAVFTKPTAFQNQADQKRIRLIKDTVVQFTVFNHVIIKRV
jgi:hypothetical protein